jgi:Ulp1 family protease
VGGQWPPATTYIIVNILRLIVEFTPKWTKGVDIFDKDFLFIPVNYKGEHWFLLVVCYPMLPSPVYTSTTPPGAVLPVARLERRPCVLVFDSVSGGAAVAHFTSSVVISYLQEEFAEKGRAKVAPMIRLNR